jgi:hypothetical protein
VTEYDSVRLMVIQAHAGVDRSRVCTKINIRVNVNSEEIQNYLNIGNGPRNRFSINRSLIASGRSGRARDYNGS